MSPGARLASRTDEFGSSERDVLRPRSPVAMSERAFYFLFVSLRRVDTSAIESCAGRPGPTCSVQRQRQRGGGWVARNEVANADNSPPTA
jgi:hypothetical protein